MTAATPDVRYATDFWIGGNASDYQGGLQQVMNSQPQRDTTGVTIRPAPHLASAIHGSTNKNASEILAEVDNKKHGEIIQSSFGETASLTQDFLPNSNGFVNAAIKAYSNHHHLKIRPEDIWLAILTQLSSYINAHSEELRGSFVAHEGKKRLEIVYDSGTRYSVDWADFAHNIGLMIQDNVVDPGLRQWIMPAFSTTTEHDTVVASIVMMASMQAYFEYQMTITCGLPSVTLLGEKADYELILHRLDKMRSYGKEPTEFADLLTPVLKRFIRSFEDPESEEVVDFWNRIFSSWNMGSGSDYYFGWITAFVFWDQDGKALNARRSSAWLDEKMPPLTLDGMTFHRISQDDVPPGFCSVPVHIDDNGIKIEAEMLAGSVGMDATSSGKQMADDETGIDTLQPRSGWWVYEKAEQSVLQDLSSLL